jgi:integrase
MGEIDLEEAIWTIPAERLKKGDEHLQKGEEAHRVPLPRRVVELLKRLKKAAGDADQERLVFPSPQGGALSNMALTEVIRRMNQADDKLRWTDSKGNPVVTHGFRSTFRDWIAECTNYPRWVGEKALAHLVGDETERAYQRGDLLEKRRKLMQGWADYCGRVQSAKVVPIGKHKTA